MLLLVPAYGLRAQTQIDASFGPMQVYQPASVTQALQLSTGERLVLCAALVRADGVRTTQRLLRYSATGVPDATFAVNIAGYSWSPQGVADAGAGRVLVTVSGPTTLNGQVYFGLVRLLPSGLVDPSFAVQPSTVSSISSIVVQPDGKLVVAGNFLSYSGQAVGNLLRLNADGTLDQPFAANTAGGVIGGTFRPVLALQPDGKIVVGGTFRVAAGQARSGLARFNANGTLDATFAPVTTATALVGAVAVQPDGNILAATFNATYLVPNVTQTLVRFTATGAYDNSFVTGNFGVRPAFFGGSTLLVQPDGKILVAFGGGLIPPGYILRLTASGATDPTWNIATAPANSNPVVSLQLLPGGQVLFGGTPQLAVSPTAVPVGLAQLTSTGALDTTFPIPVLQNFGVVNDLAQQPDGKLVIAGTFTEINGSVARGLARLNTDGSVDAAYTAACASTQGYPTKVVLQPDGKALVGGRFSGLGSVAVPSLGRVLPTGTPDPSFVPALYATAASNINSIGSIAVQPDGSVLIAGSLRQAAAVNFVNLLRLSGSGAVDNSFQPPSGLFPSALLVQPDGGIIVANNTRTAAPLYRLLPSGSPDPAFVGFAPPSSTQQFSINGLRRYPDGRLLVFGVFDELGGQTTHSVARLSAAGVPDPTFSADLPGTTALIYAAAIQPNGRILAGGVMFGNTSAPDITLARLLPDGSRDLSLDGTVNPVGTVYALDVQPNGALLVGGQFASVGAQPHFSLVRLLDANVLQVSASQPAPHTEAWPVPTHDQLHLRFDAASRPERVELHDAVGHVMASEVVSGGEMSLSLAALPVGVYLLKVQYATGATVTRRVVRN